MAPRANFAQQLLELHKSGAVAEAVKKSDETGFTNPPDGKYVGVLSEAQIGNSASSGRFQVTWQYTLTDGAKEAIGKSKYDFDGLDDPDNMKHLMKKLRRYGVNVIGFDIRKLQENLDWIVDQSYQVALTLKTGKPKPGKEPFQNIYLDQVYMNDGETKVAITAKSEGEEEAMIGGGESVADVGSEVVFTKDKKPVRGVIESIEGDIVAVIANGERHEVKADDLQLA